MYLSFIQDKIDQLQNQIDSLEVLSDRVSEVCDDIISDLQMEMRDKISEAIDSIITEHDLDNPFNETVDELQDAMVDQIEGNFHGA